MNFTIRELDAFSVIGQEIELTNSTVNNMQVRTQFWKVFNANLKRTYLSQGGYWVKYAFMRKRFDIIFFILKNMIIDFIGIEQILSLKYGSLLQNDKLEVVDWFMTIEFYKSM